MLIDLRPINDRATVAAYDWTASNILAWDASNESLRLPAVLAVPSRGATEVWSIG